jgi:hypothetical protein
VCATRSRLLFSRSKLRIGSQASMASSAAQHGAANMMSIAALPPEILERICNLLHDPDDLASCHLVDVRYVGCAVHVSAPSV